MPDQRTTPDFFVSYNVSDVQWATWIASVLEEAGFKCVIQAWDFRPGANFVLEMQKAATQAARTIAVVSPAYIGSRFGASEWAAEFANDPTGELRKLVPVRVEECDVSGLLKPIVYIDLVGLNADEAKTALLAGLGPGRAKPVKAPAFPGKRSPGAEPPSPTSTPAALVARSVDWQPLRHEMLVAWHRVNQNRSFGTYGTLLEVKLVPTDHLLIEARRLRSIGDELVQLGRQGGLFTSTQGVTVDVQASAVIARTTDRDEEAGLSVARDGQRGVWFRLPRDSMGAVFDADDLTPRLASVLRLIAQLPLGHSDRYAIAAGLTSLSYSLLVT